MTARLAVPSASRGPTTGSRARRIQRPHPATLALGVVVAAALPLYLVLGRDQWFAADEWDFLAGRELSSAHDLLRPHNEHWSTIPILVYRVLWRLFGLRTYVPYQLCIIVLHLTAAVLLYVVMRRAYVTPWIAAAAASAFALLGAGRDDIVWAFQIGFVGSLVLGLVHLLLADHDGPLGRRDTMGVVAGIAGLMCSGVSVTMTIVVGSAVFARRGWRAAAVHTVPLGAVYLGWWLVFGRDTYVTPRPAPTDVVRFVGTGVGHAFTSLGQSSVVGAALAALLLGGLGLALTDGDTSTAPARRPVAPLALAAGAVVFLVVAALGRAAILGSAGARPSRYVHLVVAMSLPALGVAADAVARRHRMMLPLVLAVLLVGVPGNISSLAHEGEASSLDERPLMLAFAQSPVAAQVPRSTRPSPGYLKGHEVTIGWLLDGVRSGRIPTPRQPPDLLADATLQVAMGWAPRGLTHEFSGCTVLADRAFVTLGRGDFVIVRGGKAVVGIARAGSTTGSYEIGSATAIAYRMLADLPVHIERETAGGVVSLCRP